MSFSADLKSELEKIKDNAKHCRIAFLAAVVCFAGRARADGSIVIRHESEKLIESLGGIIAKTFKSTGGQDNISVYPYAKGYACELRADAASEMKKALRADINEDSRISAPLDTYSARTCCSRAVLRGAFLCAGSLTDPEKSYNLGISAGTKDTAEQLSDVLETLGIKCGITKRRAYHVVYINDAYGITSALAHMGARMSLMEFENKRILREMRGSINRRVNCETSNIRKAANASAKQIEDINYIKENIGFETLSNELDEMARMRLEYPEATLRELGEKMNIGRSGVNHRLRRLAEVAQEHRKNGDSF